MNVDEMIEFKPYELSKAVHEKVNRMLADSIQLVNYMSVIALQYKRDNLPFLKKLWYNAKCDRIRNEALASYVRITLGDRLYKKKRFDKFNPAEHGINPEKFQAWLVDFFGGEL